MSPHQGRVQQKLSTQGGRTDLSPGSEPGTQTPTSPGSFQWLFPISLCPYEGFTPRLRFFGQAIAVVTQPSQGLSANESETCGLNFPQKLNSCGLRYKRENNVFQRMVWVLKNFKCWGNSLGTHLTFNYSQKSVIQKTLKLRSFQWCVICSGKITYIVIICIWRSTHLHNFVKSSHRIGENGTE